MRDRSLIHLAALLVALAAAPPSGAHGVPARAPFTIQGRVTDGAQNLVIGAQVAVEGQPIGTMTGDDGTYRRVLSRTMYLPSSVQETVGNPNPPTTP